MKGIRTKVDLPPFQREGNKLPVNIQSFVPFAFWMQHLQFLQAAEVSTVHTLVVGWRTRLRAAKRRVRLCRRPGTEFISASNSIRLLQCPLCSSNNIHEVPTGENAPMKSIERHSRTSPPWSVGNTLFFSPKHAAFVCEPLFWGQEVNHIWCGLYSTEQNLRALYMSGRSTWRSHSKLFPLRAITELTVLMGKCSL